MARRSAGILLYRLTKGTLQVLLVHPGGPFWANKDEGSWSIPKGEHDPDDDPFECAVREFAEETGASVDLGQSDRFIDLGTVRHKSGKIVAAWGAEGEIDPSCVRSNTFSMEWPPRSGRIAEYPEVDRAEWFDLPTARMKINPAQGEFIDRLVQDVGVGEAPQHDAAPRAQTQDSLF